MNPRQESSLPAPSRYEPRPGGAGPAGPAPRHDLARPARGDTLVDLLDRVLDKGVVVAGDISISLLDIELLTIKIRLLIASVDRAKEMGIDWWARDPQLSGKAHGEKLDADGELKRLRERVRELEDRVKSLPEARPQGQARQALPARRGQPAR